MIKYFAVMKTDGPSP